MRVGCSGGAVWADSSNLSGIYNQLACSNRALQSTSSQHAAAVNDPRSTNLARACNHSKALIMTMTGSSIVPTPRAGCHA